MKKIFLLLAILLAVAVYGQKKTVAVVPTLGENRDSVIKDILKDALKVGLTRSKNYTLVARGEDFRNTLIELEFQKSKMVADSLVIAFGRAINADFVCYAAVRNLDSTYWITYNIVNVATSEIPEARIKTADSDNLSKVIAEIAKELFNDEPEDWNHQAKDYKDKSEYVKAFDLLKKSDSSGNARGMCNLGYLYEMGLGTPKDNVKAVHFYTLSAEKNFAPAQYNLGLMYEYGIGVPKNINEARNWYKKAVDQGFSEAKKRLNELK